MRWARVGPSQKPRSPACQGPQDLAVTGTNTGVSPCMWAGGQATRSLAPSLPRGGGTHDAICPSRLNGSSLENDAFSDKSERENAEESDNETQDHSGKTNESGSAQSETLEGPVPRGTTYVEQVHEEFGEVRARRPGEPGVALYFTHLPEALEATEPGWPPGGGVLAAPMGWGSRWGRPQLGECGWAVRAWLRVLGKPLGQFRRALLASR